MLRQNLICLREPPSRTTDRRTWTFCTRARVTRVPKGKVVAGAARQASRSELKNDPVGIEQPAGNLEHREGRNGQLYGFGDGR